MSNKYNVISLLTFHHIYLDCLEIVLVGRACFRMVLGKLSRWLKQGDACSSRHSVYLMATESSQLVVQEDILEQEVEEPGCVLHLMG
jgi:hypothetical protein